MQHLDLSGVRPKTNIKRKHLIIPRLIILCSVIFVLSSCNKKEDKFSQEKVDAQSIVLQSLDWLKNANAAYDANQAIKKDSIYFIGVLGYAMDVPGVQEYYSLYENKIPVKIIRGTGDAIISTEMRELNSLAHEYAMQFNAIILYKLKK
jgi:hypothetical protein